MPGAFVPIAENAGLITDLTLEVLDLALAQERRWLDQGRRLSMAETLSVRHLTDPTLPGSVAAAPALHDIPPELLTLEWPIELGHNLGLQLVAEGVEDAETWQLLAALGCDVLQGFHISQPVPAPELEAWLAGWEGGPVRLRPDYVDLDAAPARRLPSSAVPPVASGTSQADRNDTSPS